MDNLENFFRDRAQRHNLEFIEGDWQKLETQLDEELPVVFSFLTLLKKFWLIPLLLIILPISWFAIYNSSTQKQTISENNTSSTQITNPDSRKFTNKEYAETQIDQKATIETEKSKTVESTATAIGASSSSSTIVHSNEQLLTEKDIKTENTIRSNTQNENLDNKSYAVFENGAEWKGHFLYSGLHFLLPISPDTDLHPGNMRTDIHEVPIIVPEGHKKSKSYFSFGLGYSPDFSTVGLGNFVAPGSRWNIFIEYSFLNRLSLNTGVVLVNNKYEAYGEDYHAPSRYWKNGIVASEAYGECKMVDIPLNLRYDVISKYRHKLFISAGASTYIVLKEDYYFEYHQDDPDLPDHWGTEKITTYPFGIINASFGYEYRVGKKSALQVEPFIKIPTTGIGWGNVDLHTIGVYFIYKFRVGRQNNF